jgi:hypothetical protein
MRIGTSDVRRAATRNRLTREEMMSFGKDEILDALGLQRRDTITDWIGPALIGFGVGAAVGASIALLLAPSAGRDLRDNLIDRGRRIVQRGREEVESMSERQEPRH